MDIVSDLASHTQHLRVVKGGINLRREIAKGKNSNNDPLSEQFNSEGTALLDFLERSVFAFSHF